MIRSLEKHCKNEENFGTSGAKARQDFRSGQKIRSCVCLEFGNVRLAVLEKKLDRGIQDSKCGNHPSVLCHPVTEAAVMTLAVMVTDALLPSVRNGSDDLLEEWTGVNRGGRSTS